MGRQQLLAGLNLVIVPVASTEAGATRKSRDWVSGKRAEASKRFPGVGAGSGQVVWTHRAKDMRLVRMLGCSPWLEKSVGWSLKLWFVYRANQMAVCFVGESAWLRHFSLQIPY